MAQNEKLTYTLREARPHRALREEVDKLTQPPSAYGTLLAQNDDGTVDVYSGGRKMRVAVHPALDPDELTRGGEVVLNESLNVVMARSPETNGEVVTVKEILEDGRRAIILGRADEERVAELSEILAELVRAGDSVLMDARSGLLLEKLPRPRSRSWSSKRCPTSATRHRRPRRADRADRRRRRAAVPPPGAVRRAQAAGPQGHPALRPAGLRQDPHRQGRGQQPGQEGGRPLGRRQRQELLPQHQGPRAAQQVRGRDRAPDPPGVPAGPEKSEEGWPVIVFFDEMDSMFRTRGTGISSDVESTIVPQLLAEIDGVESLRNVIVIGASNREDLIDPAILRPGRLDVKIKIERPNETAAAQIFARYLTADLPSRRRRAGARRRRRPSASRG